MLKIKVDYPSIDEERLILRKAAKTQIDIVLTPVVNQEQVLMAQNIINDIYVDEKVEEYILNLVFSTRNPGKYKLKDLEGLIEYGGSPRASISLVLAAKARAFLEHRGYVTPEDVRYIGADVLRHRIIVSYEAEAEEITSEDIIHRLFETVEIP
jgi:MoxR-like ATPase